MSPAQSLFFYLVSDRALNLGFFVHFLSSEVTFYLMPDASTGFVTAITAVISGLMVEVVLKAFVDAGLIDPSLILVCQLTGIRSIRFRPRNTLLGYSLPFWMVVRFRYNVLFRTARRLGVWVLLNHPAAGVVFKD
jgi:hypothetical protein